MGLTILYQLIIRIIGGGLSRAQAQVRQLLDMQMQL